MGPGGPTANSMQWMRKLGRGSLFEAIMIIVGVLLTIGIFFLAYWVESHPR